MKTSAATQDESPSRLIDAKIKELGDWRGRTLSHAAPSSNRRTRT
jgi:hypothetical protein